MFNVFELRGEVRSSNEEQWTKSLRKIRLFRAQKERQKSAKNDTIVILMGIYACTIYT